MDLIYEDLDVLPNIDVEYEKLQVINKDLMQKIVQLENQISILDDTVQSLKKRQEYLENNISSLYKTAQTECERKDKRIQELQSKLDGSYYRRGREKNDNNSNRYITGKSDTSRPSSCTSKSSTPPLRVTKDCREKRASPKKRSNHFDSGSYRNLSRDRSDNRNRDTSRSYQDKHKDTYRRHSPPKRSRLDDRKLPSSKRSKYEDSTHNSNRSGQEFSEEKKFQPKPYAPGNEKTNLKGDKDDRNKSKDLSEGTKKDDNSKGIEIDKMNVSIEEGELVDLATVIQSTSNQTANHTSNKLPMSNKPDPSTKNVMALKKSEADKISSKPKLAGNIKKIENKSEKSKVSEGTSNKSCRPPNVQSNKPDSTKLVECSTASPKIEEKKNLTEFNEPKLCETPNIPLLQSAKTDSTCALSSVASKEGATLVAPKPSSSIPADVLFNNIPLNLLQSEAPLSKLCSELLNNSLRKSVSADGAASLNVTPAGFFPNNSSIANSTQIVTSSEEIKLPNSTAGNTAVRIVSSNLSQNSIISISSSSDGNETESINKGITPQKEVANATSGTPLIVSPGVMRGKPRPRRRVGIVKMID